MVGQGIPRVQDHFNERRNAIVAVVECDDDVCCRNDKGVSVGDRCQTRPKHSGGRVKHFTLIPSS